MNEKELLYDILFNVNTYPENSNRQKIKCPDYKLTKPYSYLESIAVAIIKIHNNDVEHIEKMKQNEEFFKSSEERVKFILSGSHISYSAYYRFKYPHSNESIKEYLSDIPYW